jgi:hypothetical protein
MSPSVTVQEHLGGGYVVAVDGVTYRTAHTRAEAEALAFARKDELRRALPLAFAVANVEPCGTWAVLATEAGEVTPLLTTTDLDEALAARDSLAALAALGRLQINPSQA